MLRTFIATAGVVLFVTSALAAEGTLTNPERPVRWSGTVSKARGPTGEIPECAQGCQLFNLTVKLPAGVWTARAGGVLIAVRWAGLTSAMPPNARFAQTGQPSANSPPGAANLGDNLKLFVYRGASLLAKSDGITSLAQSVLIREAGNGPLRVYMAYDSDSPRSEIAYEALADVVFDPLPMPVRRLLPDLEARPQRHVTFDPGPIFAKAISPRFPSCYVTEVEEDGAHTCLRFDQVFANTGEGEMQVGFTVPNGSTDSAFDALQRIQWSESASHMETRRVGRVEFHPTHEHYHLTNLGLSRLWSVEPNAQPNRKQPGKVRLVRSGRKVSFCMVDTEIDAWGGKGAAARTWRAPDCLVPASKDSASSYYAQGITKGWSDVYEWYLPHQYVEVTGVPDGLYILETLADPDQQILEENEENNCVSIYLRLSKMSTASPQAQIAGPGPSCNLLR